MVYFTIHPLVDKLYFTYSGELLKEEMKLEFVYWSRKQEVFWSRHEESLAEYCVLNTHTLTHTDFQTERESAAS